MEQSELKEEFKKQYREYVALIERSQILYSSITKLTISIEEDMNQDEEIKRLNKLLDEQLH